MIAKVLQIIRPGAQWSLNGDDYDGLIWLDAVQAKPTAEEIEAATSGVKVSILANQYKQLRAAAYPSIPDQLDAIFHGGIEGWMAEIQAVKDAYPKELT